MSVYIRTKEPIKGVVEYSFKLDSVLGEVIFVENGNILLVKNCGIILFCCSIFGLTNGSKNNLLDFIPVAVEPVDNECKNCWNPSFNIQYFK